MLFELKKCIERKHIIFGAVFWAVWGVLLPIALTVGYWQVNLKAGYSSKNDIVQSIEAVAELDLSNKQKIVKLQMEERENLKNQKIPFLSDTFYESAANKATLTEVAGDYYFYGFSDMYIRKLKENGRTRSLMSARRKIQEDYDEKYVKQLEMLEKIGKPKAEFTTFMNYYENFTNISMVIIVIFLMLVFGNIGSLEYSSKMNMLLYSTPVNNMKIFAGKMICIATVGGGAMLLLDLCHIIIFFGLGYGKNLNINLNSLSLNFVYCPYSINVLQYFILKFLFGQLTILALSAAIVFISIKWKSSIITIAFTGIVTIGCYAASTIGFDNSFIVRYSFAGGISPEIVFKDFYAANIAGNIIFYPVIYAVWLLILTLICTMGIFVLAKRRR